MQRKGAFDHILLETTGLADPGKGIPNLEFASRRVIILIIYSGPIASLFWQNEEFTAGLGRDIHLDGVVCVVDAVFGKQVFCFI
jgi:G3E family GTPase